MVVVIALLQRADRAAIKTRESGMQHTGRH